MMFNLAVFSVTLFAFCLFCYYVFIPVLFQNKFVDTPNHRTLHDGLIPKGGGVMIVFGVLVFYAFSNLAGMYAPGLGFAVAFLLLAGVSLWDDYKYLEVWMRLPIHILAATIVVYETYVRNNCVFSWTYLDFLFVGLIIFWILLVMNIYNFLDGADGLSGTQALIAGFGVIVFDPYGVGLVTGLALVATSLAFITFNWHPAKIFMGDVGAVPIGFLLASLPFYGFGKSELLGVLDIIIILWFFLADGVFILLTRLFKGEKIWKAHRSHLYQRLVLSGLSHSDVVKYVMVRALLLIMGHLVFQYILPECKYYLSISFGVILFVLYYRFTLKIEKQSNRG